MISRRIECEPGNDNYRRLARYIADAGHGGEKCLLTWCAGCWAGDDEYELAIREVEDTQALNVRTAKEKTYHLMVSFRPEDESRLTPDIFKEIESEFARVLGFTEHQRHCGVHQNTDNIHLHISYNMIGKERRNRHEPYHDFEKRDRLCRELELRYGLTIDNGRDPDKEAAAANNAALAYEAHTGQESFFSYALRHKEDIIPQLSQASDWASCHKIFNQFGLALKLHGNGMIIQSIDSKYSLKASGLDRSISKSKMEKRFGLFQPPDTTITQPSKPLVEYTSEPLHQDPDRDGLYQRFQEGLNTRRAAMAKALQDEKRLYAVVCQRWGEQYKNIAGTPMLKEHRRQTMRLFKEKKQKEIGAFRQIMKEKRDEIAKRFPYTNWSQFLRVEAGRGNEAALAILRSRTTRVAAQASPGLNLSPSHKLAAVEQMQKIMAAAFPGQIFKYRIDGKGTVIFTLPDGGTVRDAGAEIHFSANNEKAKELALRLARSKWGQTVILEGQSVTIQTGQPQRPGHSFSR